MNKAAASTAVPAGEAGSGNLFTVRELQGAPTCIVIVEGRRRTGLWLHGTVIVLGTEPLSPVTCRDRGAPFDVLLKSRPDLYWHAPFPSGLSLDTTPYLQERPTHLSPFTAVARHSPLYRFPALSDWVFTTPRRLAHAAFG